MTEIRVGLGTDVHAFDAESPLALACLDWPGEIGLSGHSDGDVAAHAVMDALLSAAGLGDIGSQFGTSRPEWAGAAGSAMLQEAARMVREKGWEIGNIDSTVIAQKPKLAPHIPAMQQRIADALGVAADQVNVKAKTAEKMGPVGELLAMEANAAALIYKPVV